MRLLSLLLAFALCCLPGAAWPQQAGQPGLPFTQEQNQDGSRYVWFMFGQAGFQYDYMPARQLAKARPFRKVYRPRSGDVAWWPGYVAIVRLEGGRRTYLTAESEREPAALESLYGEPVYYRFVVPKPAPARD